MDSEAQTGQVNEADVSASPVPGRGKKRRGKRNRNINAQHHERLMQELRDSNIQLAARTRELEDKAAQLALVSKYKSEFLANMSHELRTPLNSILILAKLLADNEKGNLNKQQVEYSKTIFSAGDDLLALISQILDLSKIEAGKMEVDRQAVCVDDLRGYIERSFSQMGAQRDITFTVEVAADAPKRVTTDPQRLQQIVKNLLSNAFKFTERGSIAMTIAPVPTTEVPASLRSAPGVLALRVRDSGIGIAIAKQQLIFDAFQQADASTSRNYGGTGLGLTISRELASLLDGVIEVHSTPGEGSTFCLYLPLKASDLSHQDLQPMFLSQQSPTRSAPFAPQRPQKSTFDFTGHTVMLVDDDIRNLFAVTCLLERTGMSTVSARSGREALQALLIHPEVELVLMDMMMPEMDGFEATRAIRLDRDATQLPVIAMTAKAMPGDREQCLQAGCNDFIPKPVHAEVLLRTIGQFIQAQTVVTCD